MSDLLKEAIADAKAVRETALENAKMALEEAFTPHLKSMLSAKLSEEDVEEGMHDEDDPSREEDDEDPEEGMHDSDRKPREDDDEEEKDEGMYGSDRAREEDDEEMDESEIIEIDGVKYAPVVEGEHEDEKEDDMEEELDLESVIKELETEIAESENADEELEEGDKPRKPREEDDEDKKDESVNEEEELEEEEEIDEQSTSSGIGKGTGVKMASAGDEEDPGKGKIKESAEAMQEELNEYKEAVTFLREKLHEVNILNAKLLYTNRLFKEYVLSNDQKMKVVETFDRAQTTREIKLVYSTLAESFNDRGEINKKRSVKESASRKTNTTKPQTKIISEEDNVANRFKKLAGILKD